MKDIPNYEGKYAVDKQGNVYSHSLGRFLKNHKGGAKKNYFRVTLCYKGKNRNEVVSRLVAKTYIPNPLNLPLVDHINRDTLDNRVENLRWCSYSQSIQNQGKRKGCFSKYKGVMWDMKMKKWCVVIDVAGVKNYLGSSEDEVEMAKLYNEYAKVNYREFAVLNVV